MPKYFFHVEDGNLTRDDIGPALTDDKAAKIEAVKRSARSNAER